MRTLESFSDETWDRFFDWLAEDEDDMNEASQLEPVKSILAEQGHGHVYPRADGALARCGGPAICQVCAQEAGFPDCKAWHETYDRQGVERGVRPRYGGSRLITAEEYRAIREETPPDLGGIVAEAIEWMAQVQLQSNPPGTAEKARADFVKALAEFIDDRIAKSSMPIGSP